MKDRRFKIDFEKIKSIDDVIMVIKGMDLIIYFNPYDPLNDCPDRFKDLYEGGYLKDITNDYCQETEVLKQLK